MTCIKCRKADLRNSKGDFPTEIKGEPVLVSRMPCLECPNCGYRTIPGDKVAEFMRLASDVYRKKNLLLTSEEIRDSRSSLRMNQGAFANYLGGVGVASVKRWEMGKVQDRAMDKLIRLMTDLDEASDNVSKIAALQLTRREVGIPPISWIEAEGTHWSVQRISVSPSRGHSRSVCS
jgi:putative zinc finger/helix-turn-helix YgiT family protein